MKVLVSLFFLTSFTANAYTHEFLDSKCLEEVTAKVNKDYAAQDCSYSGINSESCTIMSEACRITSINVELNIPKSFKVSCWVPMGYADTVDYEVTIKNKSCSSENLDLEILGSWSY
jgi:hypothetical protein